MIYPTTRCAITVTENQILLTEIERAVTAVVSKMTGTLIVISISEMELGREGTSYIVEGKTQ